MLQLRWLQAADKVAGTYQSLFPDPEGIARQLSRGHINLVKKFRIKLYHATVTATCLRRCFSGSCVRGSEFPLLLGYRGLSDNAGCDWLILWIFEY